MADTSRNDLRLELGVVYAASAGANLFGIFGESIHVSTKKLSGHEHPKMIDLDQGADELEQALKADAVEADRKLSKFLM